MRQPGTGPHASFVARSGYYQESPRVLDNSVPAVRLRIDPDPFHYGTPGAVRSLGRREVPYGGPDW
jgi:hypothetical protein